MNGAGRLSFFHNILSPYPEPEGRALAESASHAVVVVMELEHSLDDRQSETCSDDLTFMVFGAVILVEDELYFILLDAVAGVLNFNEDSLGGIYLADEDLLVLTGIINRIVDEVIDDLLYLHDVAADSPRLIGGEVDIVAHFLGDALEAADYLGELAAYLEFRGTQFLPAALKLGEVKDVVDHEGKAVGLVNDDLEVFVAFHRIIA